MSDSDVSRRLRLNCRCLSSNLTVCHSTHHPKAVEQPVFEQFSPAVLLAHTPTHLRFEFPPLRSWRQFWLKVFSRLSQNFHNCLSWGAAPVCGVPLASGWALGNAEEATRDSASASGRVLHPWRRRLALHLGRAPQTVLPALHGKVVEWR